LLGSVPRFERFKTTMNGDMAVEFRRAVSVLMMRRAKRDRFEVIGLPAHGGAVDVMGGCRGGAEAFIAANATAERCNGSHVFASGGAHLRPPNIKEWSADTNTITGPKRKTTTYVNAEWGSISSSSGSRCTNDFRILRTTCPHSPYPTRKIRVYSLTYLPFVEG
jgi:hypothetical protein